MGNLTLSMERINRVLEQREVSSIEELAERSGLSSSYLSKLRMRGLVGLPYRKRGRPLNTYGPIAENLGVLEMLTYLGFPITIIAKEIGVTKSAVWEYIKNRPELHKLWVEERKSCDGPVAENLGVFEMLSYMGAPQKIIAGTLGVSPFSLNYHYKKDPRLYRIWRRERQKYAHKDF